MKVTHHTTELAQIIEQQKKNSVSQNQEMNVAAEENAEGVTLEISEEAKQKYMEKSMEQYMLEHNMEVMRKQADTAEEYGNEMGKVMTIFRRIAHGDIVPWSDEKKLMEYSSEMYQAAKNIGAMSKNEDPEEYESVDDEDDKDSNGAVDAETAVKALVGDMEGDASSDLEF